MAFRKTIFLIPIFILTMASALNAPTDSEPKGGKVPTAFAEDEKDSKGKLSDEIVMFGNQQNKPAGMIDDALAEGLKSTTNGDNQENETTIHEGKRQTPITSGGEIETSHEDDDTAENTDESMQPFDRTTSWNPESPPNKIDSDDSNDQMADSDFPYNNQFYGIDDVSGWQYPGYPASHYRRFRRNAGKKSIQASLDQLLNSDKRGRAKRELRLTEEEIARLLQYLPNDIQQEPEPTWEDENFLNAVPEMPMMPESVRNNDFNRPLDPYQLMLMSDSDVDVSNDYENENQDWPIFDPTLRKDFRTLNMPSPMEYLNPEDEDTEAGNPNWEPLEERFFKRRLQGSDEDDDDDSNENQNWLNENEAENLRWPSIW